jgi:hypothetical protein
MTTAPWNRKRGFTSRHYGDRIGTITTGRFSGQHHLLDVRPASAPPGARKVWSDITPLARRDWIHWIVSARQAETRARRIRTACDMLAKGKRRPCCFDRSGMYAKSLSWPVADDASM